MCEREEHAPPPINRSRNVGATQALIARLETELAKVGVEAPEARPLQIVIAGDERQFRAYCRRLGLVPGREAVRAREPEDLRGLHGVPVVLTGTPWSGAAYRTYRAAVETGLPISEEPYEGETDDVG